MSQKIRPAWAWIILAGLIPVVISTPVYGQVIKIDEMPQQMIHMIQNDYGDVVVTFQNNHNNGIKVLDCQQFNGPILSQLPVGVIERNQDFEWSKWYTAQSYLDTTNMFGTAKEPFKGIYDFFHIDGQSDINRHSVAFNEYLAIDSTEKLRSFFSIPGEDTLRNTDRI